MSVYLFKTDKFSSHMKIIRYLKRLDNKRLKILDVGCSKGFIGKQLCNNYDFYGIDASIEDAKIAKKYYKDLKIADLDGKKPKYEKDFFDVIIMADVIEHLKDPLSTILYFKKSLKKDGIIICSVPNIANIYIRLKILFGNFDYEEKGILDKTHLKFFTHKSIKNLIKKANLTIFKEDITPIPLPIINPIFSDGNLLSILHKINFLMAIVWKTMFSFQFIFFCKK